MGSDEFVSSRAWLSELFETHALEIRERQLIVLREFDARFLVAPSGALEAALRGLFDFAVATTPDHCEIYLATARTTRPVAELGSGSLTMRWQVVGERLRLVDAPTVALRPIPGDPADHVRSKRASALTRAFDDAGWRFELSVVSRKGELLARAWHD
jgi:hypothetical protein